MTEVGKESVQESARKSLKVINHPQIEEHSFSKQKNDPSGKDSQSKGELVMTSMGRGGLEHTQLFELSEGKDPNSLGMSEVMLEQALERTEMRN